MEAFKTFSDGYVGLVPKTPLWRLIRSLASCVSSLPRPQFMASTLLCYFLFHLLFPIRLRSIVKKKKETIPSFVLGETILDCVAACLLSKWREKLGKTIDWLQRGWMERFLEENKRRYQVENLTYGSKQYYNLLYTES